MCKIGTTFASEKGLGVKKQNRDNMEVGMWVFTFHEVFTYLLMTVTSLVPHWVFRSWVCVRLCLCVIYGFVMSVKVNGIWNCAVEVPGSERVFHLGKSLGLYEGFFWANSICKLKVIVTDAYVWALTQWYILEMLTHNPHNNHVNSCYSWLKFGICPWSPGQSHHWTQVSLILNAVFVPLCYFVVLHQTWNVFWFRSMDNVKKHKILEKLLG